MRKERQIIHTNAQARDIVAGLEAYTRRVLNTDVYSVATSYEYDATDGIVTIVARSPVHAQELRARTEEIVAVLRSRGIRVARVLVR